MSINGQILNPGDWRFPQQGQDFLHRGRGNFTPLGDGDFVPLGWRIFPPVVIIPEGMNELHRLHYILQQEDREGG